MGLFDRFKKKKKSVEVRIGNLDEVEVVPIEEDKIGSIYDEVQKAVIKRLEEQRRLNELLSQVYYLDQKVIVWFDGREPRIKGYPIAMRKDLDEYVILYQVRPPDWLDNIWYSLGRLLGKKPPQKLIRVHESQVWFGREIILIHASAFEVNHIGEEIALPLEKDVLKVELWKEMKASRDAWRAAYMNLARQVAKATDLALKINPNAKLYNKTKLDLYDKSGKRKIASIDDASGLMWGNLTKRSDFEQEFEE
ncbi:hypothetical protein [Pyrococcus horikoshii]|uniref:Uncharacterized protein n=2 Tax=Pyrococcus horikoshii TaxID=53953 RepID=O58909_PYRHO|nr:hypothetical protein [Pyrococcus horikoshii]BAA30286.1 250aa long hypothetical protein [Pyrococcus horikoshii OT3]HII60200.1 hypothetical protein [Pyrococcus horikoshii]